MNKAQPNPAPGFVAHPDHRIEISECAGRQRAIFEGEVIADSTHAVLLQEANYPPVIYFPPGDVNMALLERTDNASHCPFKGDASYWPIAGGSAGGKDHGKNAAWSYQTPYDEMTRIRDYIAFYADRVTVGP